MSIHINSLECIYEYIYIYIYIFCSLVWFKIYSYTKRLKINWFLCVIATLLDFVSVNQTCIVFWTSKLTAIVTCQQRVHVLITGDISVQFCTYLLEMEEVLGVYWTILIRNII